MNIKRSLSYTGGVIVVLLVLALITITLLPITIKWQVNNWFEEQGLVSQVKDVELNLTEGQFIIRGFAVNNANTNLLSMGHLLVQIRLRDLLSNKLTIEKINIGDGYLDINRNNEGLMQVAGIKLDSKDDKVVNNHENAETINKDESDLWQLSLSEILLSNIKICYKAAKTPANAAYHACGQLAAFDWHGPANYTIYPEITRALSEARLDIQASLYGFAIQDVLSGQTVARIDSLNIDKAEMKGISKIAVSGVELNHVMLLQPIQAEKVSEYENYIYTLNQLSAKDFVIKDLSEASMAEMNASNAILSRFTGSNEPLNIMRFDEMLLSGISATGVNEINLKKIEINNYKVLQPYQSGSATEPADYVFSSKQFTAKNFNISELSDLSADALTIAGLNMLIVIDSKGQLDLKKAIKQVAPPETASEQKSVKGGTDQKSGARPVSIKIGELAVGDNSRVIIRDESVKPVFNDSFTNIQLTMKDIDMSDKDVKTQINLSVVVGEQGNIQASGNAQLFSDQPDLDIKADLSGINIGEFDAYANRIVQQKVKSGHLDAKLKVKIEKGKLDSKADVTLHKFYIEKLDQAEKDQYKEKLGMPLSSALSLLRNRDDSITLTIPVTGDINNPDFSLGDVFRKVSALAIKEAVIYYYTPFGLVKLLTAGFDLATTLRFEPVTFEAGQSVINEQDKARLDKLATLLIERPNVYLVVCGHSTRKDFSTMFPQAAAVIKKQVENKKRQDEASDKLVVDIASTVDIPLQREHREKLVELAGNRGKVVKQYLVEKHKIESGRLILCNPEFKYEDEGKMRAEISI